MIRVLVVDDQALIRDSFRLILDLEPDIEVVGEAGDGREAVAQVRTLQPDVVLMDVRMPVLDGLGATAALTRAGSAAPTSSPRRGTTRGMGRPGSHALRSPAVTGRSSRRGRSMPIAGCSSCSG